MNTSSRFTKYHLCKRCLKELSEAAEAPAQQPPEQATQPLAQQIEQQSAAAEYLCTSCQALAQLQDNWKPFPLGTSIGAIFFVPDKPEAKEQ